MTAVTVQQRTEALTGLLRVAFTDAGAAWDLREQLSKHERYLQQHLAQVGRANPRVWRPLQSGSAGRVPLRRRVIRSNEPRKAGGISLVACRRARRVMRSTQRITGAS